MRPGCPEDLTHLLSFVAGEEWIDEHEWRKRVRDLQSGGVAEKAALTVLLRPLFLRRTKAAVRTQLKLPAQKCELLHVMCTPAEVALRSEFVLRSALRLSLQENAVLSDELLATHLGLSSLSPELWVEWGHAGGRASSGPAGLVGELGSREVLERASQARQASQASALSVDLWKTLDFGAQAEFKKRRSEIGTEVKQVQTRTVTKDAIPGPSSHQPRALLLV